MFEHSCAIHALGYLGERKTGRKKKRSKGRTL